MIFPIQTSEKRQSSTDSLKLRSDPRLDLVRDNVVSSLIITISKDIFIKMILLFFLNAYTKQSDPRLELIWGNVVRNLIS